MGGALGVAVATLGVKAFSVFGADGIPRVAFVTVDWRVVTFAVTLSIVTGVLFGLLPAVRTANSDFSSTLKESALSTTHGRGRNKMRNALVIVEIALALMLLVGAGLLFNSFLLGTVAMLACYLPARKAARANPLDVMKAE